MATQIIDLGKIRWSWQGDWSSATEYELNDVVKHGGNLYIYISETPATNVATSTTASWSLAIASSSWKGAYASGTAYKINEVVSYGGATYISKGATTGNLPTNATYWDVFTNGLSWQGAYDSETSYKKNEAVSFGNNAYIAVANTTGNVPTDVLYWDLLVSSYPSITGNADTILFTDGSTVSWTDSITLDTVEVTTKLTAPEGGTYVGADAEAWGTTAALTDPIAVFSIDGGADSYAQLSVHNDEPTSSTDIIAYADNGNDTSGWIDLGITGSQFDQTNFGITGQNDGYLFYEAPGAINLTVNNKALTDNVATLTMGSSVASVKVGNRLIVTGVGAPFNGEHVVTAVNTGAGTVSYAKTNANVTSAVVSPAGSAVVSGKGNLVIATGANGTDNNIVIAAGGYDSGNTQMVIIPDEMVHVEIATASTSPTTGALVVAGGVGITGDTFTDGDITIDGLLFAGPDAPGFNTASALTDPAIVAVIDGGADSYAQIAFKNNTATSSTDFLAYMDNGTDSEGWIDMGITGSEFDSATFGITGPGDGYIFHETKSGPTGPVYGGNLVLATGANGTENKIVFAAGGFDSGNTQMEITPGVNVHIEIPTPSTSPTTGALTVVGGVGIQGDMNVEGSVFIEGTITFGGAGTTVETSNLAVTDPAVFVGTNNQADIVDLAFIGEYATTISTITRSITNKALASNVATLTTSVAHTYLVGDVVVVTDVDTTFNGTFNITAVGGGGTTFSYNKTAANVTSTAVSPAGTAAVSARRKFAGIARDASDGVIKVFKDATTKPTSTVNFSEAGLAFADVRVNAITAASATIGDVSNTELQYLDGVTSAIQTQINSKADASNTALTGGVVITASGTTAKPLIVRGVSSQTANLFEIQNSSSTGLLFVDSAGKLGVGASPSGTLDATGSSSRVRWDLTSSTAQQVTTNTAANAYLAHRYDALSHTWSTSSTARVTLASDGAFSAPLVRNTQTSSYGLVLADAGRLVEVSNTGATTITVPTNASHAFPEGTQINILQTNSGQVSIAGAGGVSVNASPGLKLRAQWSFATLIKRGENTWVLVGDLTA
jgi:hypothetical protein